MGASIIFPSTQEYQKAASSVILGVGAATIDLAVADVGDYSFIIRVTGRGDGAVGADLLSARPNNDSTAANYKGQYTIVQDATLTTTKNNAARGQAELGAFYGTLANAAGYDNFELYFPNAFSAVNPKYISSIGRGQADFGANGHAFSSGICQWNVASAISSVRLFLALGGKFAAGTMFQVLYCDRK